ncbi:hypothetical protein RRF57_011978 [Xylaria bambusicola]|uniref:Uncharacterized protein n=1 Tax=Xylaria bambusicola TaxID=326684 RepID=A0AAN7V047_9PEZI
MQGMQPAGGGVRNFEALGRYHAMILQVSEDARGGVDHLTFNNGDVTNVYGIHEYDSKGMFPVTQYLE